MKMILRLCLVGALATGFTVSHVGEANAIFGALKDLVGGKVSKGDALKKMLNTVGNMKDGGLKKMCQKGSAFSGKFSIRSGAGILCDAGTSVAALAISGCYLRDYQGFRASGCAKAAMKKLRIKEGTAPEVVHAKALYKLCKGGGQRVKPSALKGIVVPLCEQLDPDGDGQYEPEQSPDTDGDGVPEAEEELWD